MSRHRPRSSPAAHRRGEAPARPTPSGLRRGLARLLPTGGTLPDDVWAHRHRAILALLWAHVPGLFAFALARGNGIIHSLVEAGIVAVAATGATLFGDARREATVAAAVGLLTASAVLVHLSGGMIEAHFHFFVMVGVVVLYEDWRPFLVTVAFVVVHHGFLGVAAAADVFDHPAGQARPWLWAGIHGAYIAAMSTAAVTSWSLNEAVRRAALRGEQQLAEAQELARLGSWEWDVAADRAAWSEELFHLLGLEPGTVTPSYDAYLARVHPQDREPMARAIGRAVARMTPFSADVRIVQPDGGLRWVHARGEPVVGEGEDSPRLRGTLQDVTERKAAEEALRESEERFRRIVETAHEGVWTLDVFGRTTFVNARMAAMLGSSPEALTGRLFLEFVDRASRDAVRRRLGGDTTGADRHFDVQLQRADGGQVWVLVSVTRLSDGGGGLSGMLAMVSDITDRKRAEQLLAHQALHDPLTGLPNRTLLLDRLGVALARGERHPEPVAVLFLDLDHFKVVNDTLGHSAGDQLLVEVAVRLRRAVRPMDTVARFGGDEFAVLCEGIAGEDGARHLARRIAAALAAPVVAGGREVGVSASVGIALAEGGDGADAEIVLRDADAAMYRAKERGRNRHEVFDVAMRARLLERLEIEEALREALERDELRLHYQPEVSLRDGRITGVEALVRWEHPRRGLVGPAEFLSVAEDTGLIVPLGRWVLGEACRQVAAWQRSNPAVGTVTVWVNLSARQLAQPDVVDVVAGVLAGSGLDAACLGVEITESTFMDVRVVGPVLRALKRLGVQLAVDDFGTGFSSMNYLKEFPVDILKVDQSFVAGLGRDAGDSAIVAAVVGLAHSLGLEAIAEGVESYQHLAGLHALGCDRAQGYYFSAPVPAEEMEHRLVASRTAAAALGGPAVPATFGAAGGAPDGTPRRVVVCDDDPRLRRVLRDAFEAAGAVVAEAGDGDECLAVAELHRPDVVVLDVLMPGGDGFSVLPRLRAGFPSARVVTLTAFPAGEVADRSRALGADACLDKVHILGAIDGLVDDLVGAPG